MENSADSFASPQRLEEGNKMLALPPADRNSRMGLSGQKQRDFVISSNKKQSSKELMLRGQTIRQEEEINNRIKKSLIVTMLLKIQNLREEPVNNALKDMLLNAQKQYKDLNNGYLHNGIMALLKYYADPDQLFNQYLATQERTNTHSSRKLKGPDQKMLGYESDEKTSPLVSAKKTMGTRSSVALVPITENHHNIRALHELELIKKFKRDKE